jgi:hypothetical protein
MVQGSVPVGCRRSASLQTEPAASNTGPLATSVPKPVKGTVPRDFRLQVFYMDHFPPNP